MPQDVRESSRAAADPTRERMLASSPVTDRRVTLAGISTAVLDGGSGPPLVLLHSAGEFAGVWLAVLPDLVRTHRVIAADLPGHGASGVAAPLDAEHALRWLGELVELAGPERPVVVARGLGAAMAARAAVGRAAISGLVLVSAHGLAEFAPAPGLAAAAQEFAERPSARTRDLMFAQCFVDLDGVRRQWGEGWAAVADYALERATEPEMGAALDHLMPAFGLPAIPPADLARIPVPTTLIWGRADLHVLLPVAEAASARYGWPLHVLDDVGDDPGMERPEAFLAALRTAVAAPAGRTSP
ncbi:alpha/beta fold hydrolase [Pseudonocardia lacus]|uniref:alpha/beta fold hydrolase n=1 Tax=Pseudonocardia lacus TaxID=2835865 RepID=UPI001BDC9BBC|nr:alpha/beta fold hydrolase [Pseudonocardia lacus]